jgi:hypothetical protein
MNKVFIASIVLILLSVACGSSEPTPSPRCLAASELQMEYIRNGIKQIQESNDALNGYAVRSNDYQRVWFVSAEITGPGIEAKQAIGLWAMSGDLEFPTTVFSVDGFAKEFSYWSDGTKAEPQLSISDDGAQDALSCAKYSQ